MSEKPVPSSEGTGFFRERRSRYENVVQTALFLLV